MSQKARIGDLEISQDLQFQRREWVVQRVGWLVMTALLVAALAGLFGTGPLSKTTAGDQASPLQAEYYRFWRMASPMPLRLRIAPSLAGQGEVGVWVSRAYLEAMRVESITPEPARVEAGTDHFVYVFRLKEPATVISVMFSLEPDRAGRISGQVGLNEESVLTLRHFIYP